MHPIGIDLGTTYSAIAKWKQAKNFTGSDVYNITSESSDVLPSKVFVEKDEDTGKVTFIVGKTALTNTFNKPDNGVFAVKRDMDDIENNKYEIEGQVYDPVDISAEILKALLKNVEAIEKPDAYVPKGAVVTVPYYFKTHQKLNTKNALLKALNDLYGDRCSNPDELFLGLVAEPIAAGLDFAFNNADLELKDENFLVFDLGGGTFDVTVFSLTQNAESIVFEVKGVGGHNRLGGEDFDHSLSEWVWKEEGFDLGSLDDKNKKRVLKKAVPIFTEAKETLTSNKSTGILIPQVAPGMSFIDKEVKRKDFNSCLTGQKGNTERNFLSEIECQLDNVLNKANLKPNEINSVLLTGGSSRIPLFNELIESKFGANKVRQMADVNLAVARGAAVYAAYLLDKRLEKNGEAKKHLDLWKEIVVVEPTAHAFGIPAGKSEFYLLIKDHAITPASKTIPIVPSTLSADGKTILFDEIKVLEGNLSEHSNVGTVDINETLYTHGRSAKEIKGELTLTADKNLMKIRIRLPKCKENGEDFILEQDLSLNKS
jgi:molecular chaperone DnaK